MRYVCVGVEKNKGDFTDEAGRKVEYDNVVLQCVCSDPNPALKAGMYRGCRVGEVKMKNDFDNLVYAGDNKVYAFSDLVGCELDIAIDADKKILGVAVLSMDGIEKLIS